MHGQENFEQRTQTAGSLQIDDYVSNLGVVLSTTDVGAFVLVQFAGNGWDLVTGRLVETVADHVFHAADGVVVNV